MVDFDSPQRKLVNRKYKLKQRFKDNLYDEIHSTAEKLLLLIEIESDLRSEASLLLAARRPVDTS